MNSLTKAFILITSLVVGFFIAAAFIKTLGEITGAFLFFALLGLAVCAMNLHERVKVLERRFEQMPSEMTD